MNVVEERILNKIYVATGTLFSAIENIPIICQGSNREIYRILLSEVHNVTDGARRWEILRRFNGPGSNEFLPELLSLLAHERDRWSESTVYQAIGRAITPRNANKIWEVVEHNMATEGYIIFAERLLKLKSMRDRVASKLIQHVESGTLSEDLMLALANCKDAEVSEAARRILGPHPQLRCANDTKFSRGLWKKVFEPGELAALGAPLHSFNCDVDSVLQDLEDEHASALERIRESHVTADHIISIPEGKVAALSGTPGLLFHRIDSTEMEVMIFEHVESRRKTIRK